MDICAAALIRFAERHAAEARAQAGARKRPPAQSGAGTGGCGLRLGAGQRPAHLLGSAAVLLVCPPGRDHRVEHLGLVLPGPAGPAPRSLLPARARGGHAHPRAGGRTAALFLDQIQQPARSAQGRRHRGGVRHLHRFRPDQRRRPAPGRLGRGQRGQLSPSGRDRRDAPAPAQLLHPGQQEKPGPLHPARRQDHPHRLWPALDLQLRPDRPGAGAPGQDRWPTRAAAGPAAASRWAPLAKRATS